MILKTLERETFDIMSILYSAYYDAKIVYTNTSTCPNCYNSLSID